MSAARTRRWCHGTATAPSTALVPPTGGRKPVLWEPRGHPPTRVPAARRQRHGDGFRGWRGRTSASAQHSPRGRPNTVAVVRRCPHDARSRLRSRSSALAGVILSVRRASSPVGRSSGPRPAQRRTGEAPVPRNGNDCGARARRPCHGTATTTAHGQDCPCHGTATAPADRSVGGTADAATGRARRHGGTRRRGRASASAQHSPPGRPNTVVAVCRQPSPVAGCRLPVAGCPSPVAGCRFPVAGCPSPVPGCRLPVAGPALTTS